LNFDLTERIRNEIRLAFLLHYSNIEYYFHDS